jgi:SAM-dependent methyltransferase
MDAMVLTSTRARNPRSHFSPHSEENCERTGRQAAALRANRAQSCRIAARPGSVAPIAMPDWDDTDYSTMAADYAAVRRPDPRIGAQLAAALGDARTVINVGAGTGSYEPIDRTVVAAEPAAEMRARRDPALPPPIDATADALPFDDDSFDAALAVFTVHHWPDLEAGLAETRRVTRGPVVIMTADPEALAELWLAEYAPEFHEVERQRYPSLERVAAGLGAAIGSAAAGGPPPARRMEVRPLQIPLDCTDGFSDAFYGRPEAMLDPAVRRAQSAWSFVGEADQERFVKRLSADLESGAWDERLGHLRTQPEFEGSIRILIA